jgi:predicted DNA-binding protein YlxM (UPF0122 family)
MEAIKKINFRKSPFRGVLTEVAKEESVSPQAIWDAINTYQNPRILAILTQKIQLRKKTIVDYKKELQEAIV